MSAMTRPRSNTIGYFLGPPQSDKMDERSLSHATDFASHCLLCAQESCYEDSCTRGDGKSGSIQPLQIGEGDSFVTRVREVDMDLKRYLGDASPLGSEARRREIDEWRRTMRRIEPTDPPSSPTSARVELTEAAMEFRSILINASDDLHAITSLAEISPVSRSALENRLRNLRRSILAIRLISETATTRSLRRESKKWLDRLASVYTSGSSIGDSNEVRPELDPAMSAFERRQWSKDLRTSPETSSHTTFEDESDSGGRTSNGTATSIDTAAMSVIGKEGEGGRIDSPFRFFEARRSSV